MWKLVMNFFPKRSQFDIFCCSLNNKSLYCFRIILAASREFNAWATSILT